MMIQELENAIAEVCQQLFGQSVQVELTRPDAQFGDYACNVALQLAKQVNQNPREVAEKIKDGLQHAAVKSIDIAGPGFINLRLSDDALWQLAQATPDKSYQGKTVLVEYSDPNPLKPLHAGHLYTTLVGDSISKLFEAAGAHVIRLNYGGDVGLHVGKSMWAILGELGGEHPEKLDEVDDKPVWLGKRYVEGNNAYEDDEQARHEIIEVNKKVYQLHADNDHDSPFARVYWTVRQWSYDYFNVLYDQLQVAPFDRFIPESEVSQVGLEAVRAHQKEGVYTESQGAVVFEGEKHGLHTRVFINSEGLPTYETKDVGLLLTKWRDYQFDLSLVITAHEQAQYYEVMLKSVEQFMPEPVRRSRHLTHGTVKLQGGQKMSSRKGNVVTALEILDAARAAGEAGANKTSEDTMLAAVKYAFAKVRIGGDIIYDAQESVALEGNSGPYLQYAHARAASILRKAPEQPSSNEAVELNESERTLLRKLGEYHEVIDRAVNELMPHHVCTYLYELAQEFNRFYEQNKVIGSNEEASRLKLVTHYKATLQTGLQLLHITAPEQM